MEFGLIKLITIIVSVSIIVLIIVLILLLITKLNDRRYETKYKYPDSVTDNSNNENGENTGYNFQEKYYNIVKTILDILYGLAIGFCTSILPFLYFTYYLKGKNMGYWMEIQIPLLIISLIVGIKLTKSKRYRLGVTMLVFTVPLTLILLLFGGCFLMISGLS